MQRFAICNETFGDWPWEKVCRLVADLGYHGIEIVGLHRLLASPKGLHIHTRDEALRQKTVDYLRALVDFAGDVGARVMIFGSPFQRKLEEGDVAGAWERTQDSFRE